MDNIGGLLCDRLATHCPNPYTSEVMTVVS